MPARSRAGRASVPRPLRQRAASAITLGASMIAIAFMISAGPALANSPPVVSNVQAQQRVGTHLVDITYDVFDADGDPLKVMAFLSTNGGTSYTIALVTATGAIGEGVLSGNGRTIVWNAGVDLPGFNSADCSVRIVADDGPGTPHVVILFDRSSSMGSAFASSNRYISVRNALQTVLSDLTHAGLVAGMNFFPVWELPDADQCDLGLYNPLQVSTGTLPGHSAALVAAMDAQLLFGSAPTTTALEGSLDHLVAHRSVDTEDPCSVVLITDGPSELCGSGVGTLVGLASDALGSGVRTYVVTLDAAFKTALDALAEAGGTTAAWSPGTQAELAAHLSAIFASAMAQ